MNYYQPFRVQAKLDSKQPAEDPSDLYASYVWPNRRMNEYRGWEIYPEALYDVAMLRKRSIIISLGLFLKMAWGLRMKRGLQIKRE